MDKIFLSALTVECIVGIWEWERRVKQTVIIDIEMAADIRKAAATDRIEDTIDYKRVSKRLQAFIGESQFHLVETLTEQIARVIVTEFGVQWVKVRGLAPTVAQPESKAADPAAKVRRSRSTQPA